MSVFAPTDERANDLVLRLYQAAQDRSLLPSFMIRLGECFDSHVVGLRIHDSGCDAFTSHYVESTGMSVAEWQAWDRRVGERNFWRIRGFSDLMAKGVGHDRMIASRRELIRTSFYDDLCSLDIESGMGIQLWSGKSGQAAVLSLNRPAVAGAYGEEEIAFAQHVLPHLRSAYSIMRRLSWMDTTALSIANAIDRLHIGVLLIDIDGVSSYRNGAADRMLEQRAGLQLMPGGRIRCTALRAQRSLDAAVHDSVHGRLSSPRRIAIRDAEGKLRLVLVVTMLRGELIPWSGADEPCAMVFIHQPASAASDVDSSRWQDVLQLTPAEVRLARLIATGYDPSACAALLDVSITTIRTQLRSLFQKTETRRQPELVALLTFLLQVT